MQMNEEVTTASKVIYLAVRMEICNPDKKEITDDDIKDIISNVDYEFNDYGRFSLETEIRGTIDPSLV